MGSATCTDDDFIALWDRLGGATAVARELGVGVRAAHDRRRTIEARRGISLKATSTLTPFRTHPAPRVTIENFTGRMVVFSDAHYWPGDPTLAHRALVEVVVQVDGVDCEVELPTAKAFEWLETLARVLARLVRM